MTPANAIAMLDRLCKFIAAERLSCESIMVHDDGSASVDVTPADFATFVLQHRLKGKVHTSKRSKGITCSVRFGRAIRVYTFVTTPAHLAGLGVKQTALEAMPPWTPPMLEVADVG